LLLEFHRQLEYFVFFSDEYIPTRKETFKIQGGKTETTIKHCRFELFLSSSHFLFLNFYVASLHQPVLWNENSPTLGNAYVVPVVQGEGIFLF